MKFGWGQRSYGERSDNSSDLTPGSFLGQCGPTLFDTWNSRLLGASIQIEEFTKRSSLVMRSRKDLS